MTPSDKLREFIHRRGSYSARMDMENSLSDLTALISEDYVEKAKYDEAVRQRDELREVAKMLIDWDWKFPISKIYSNSEALELEDAISAIVKAAEAAIKNTETK